ncbi:MAG TPA: ABC transporter substrate-binding protein [Geobacter sp.]|nr:ABC transporter substrate-binding protein [Geobacter sp.]
MVALISLWVLSGAPAPLLAAGKPVFIGLDAEFGYASSTSAEAIRQGIEIAMDEINRAGGVLGGRPLALETRANHSVPARSIENIKELAQKPDLVAVFCGRFSPTVLEALPTLHNEKMILLDPWSAADAIVENRYRPNYAFRLSLKDSWAMDVMLRHAQKQGASRVGMLLLNTSWGRSSLKGAEKYAAAHPGFRISGTNWFNWNDKSFIEKYQSLRQGGARAVILVANANEAEILIKEVAALPAAQRLPIVSHWGVTGGTLAELAGPALGKVDFSVVQTYSFIGDQSAKARRVVAAHNRLFKTKGARQIKSPVGVAHAYDLTHILALAINKAGSTDRKAIRSALEQLGGYRGLIKEYRPPFTPQRHEALSPDSVFMAGFAEDGAIVRKGARSASRKD